VSARQCRAYVAAFERRIEDPEFRVRIGRAARHTSMALRGVETLDTVLDA